MELLFVLALLGIAYCGYSNTPPMTRLFEVTTVIATLALVYYAQLTAQPLSVSLPIAVLFALPLWLACIQARTKLAAQSQRADASTEQMWQKWNIAKNPRKAPVNAANESLSERLDATLTDVAAQGMPAAKLEKVESMIERAAGLSLQEQVAAKTATEFTDDLELVPMEDWRHKRRL